MTEKRRYFAPALTVHGDVAAITGFTGSDSQQDVIFVPNGPISFDGPSSEYACEIPDSTADNCLPGTPQ